MSDRRANELLGYPPDARLLLLVGGSADLAGSTGTATVAQYQTALRSITYNNNSNYPNTLTRTVTATSGWSVTPPARDCFTATQDLLRKHSAAERRELAAISMRLESEHPASNRGWTPRVEPLAGSDTGAAKLALIALMGAVNAVVPHAELETTALEWAREINGKSPTAQRMLKYAFNLIDDGLVGQQLFAGETTRLAYMTDEAVEGRDAFLEKRDPDWSNYPYYF